MPRFPDQPRTVLHIGAPKTGSTTLQEQVFPELRSICFMGKPWWNPDIPYDKCVALHQAIDSVTRADLDSYDPEAAAFAVRDWLGHAPRAGLQADGRPLLRLLSEERLTFSDTVDLGEIARRLSRLFPDGEIVYVRRDPVAGLRSFHRWLYARAWIDSGFSEWLDGGLVGRESEYAAIALRSHDWALIEKSFGAHFPVVRRLDFQDMLDDPVAYLARLLGQEHPEFADFAWLKDRPLNISRGRGASEVHRAAKKAVRLWNRLPLGKIEEKPEYLGDTPLWRRFEWLGSALPVSEEKFRITDEDRSRIRAYYTDSATRRAGTRDGR